jgi:hypothetical protein
MTLHAGQQADLTLFVAKAAATVKTAIPGSQAEIQGTTALVKKRTALAPNMHMEGSHVMPGSPQRVEIPDAYGVMFVIQAEPYGKTQPVVRKNPVFDRQRAKAEKMFMGGYYRTSAVQPFPKANAVLRVEILYGEYTDMQILERAYAELTRFPR